MVSKTICSSLSLKSCIDLVLIRSYSSHPRISKTAEPDEMWEVEYVDFVYLFFNAWFSALNYNIIVLWSIILNMLNKDISVTYGQKICLGHTAPIVQRYHTSLSSCVCCIYPSVLTTIVSSVSPTLF